MMHRTDMAPALRNLHLHGEMRAGQMLVEKQSYTLWEALRRVAVHLVEDIKQRTWLEQGLEWV
jgi:hypothetical protein